MRIRTIKPEFWTHPLLAREADDVRLLAIGVLTYADDEGYFMADPVLMRNALWPYDETPERLRRTSGRLAEIGYIELSTHPTHGMVGRVVNFLSHQRISHPTPSKIKAYFIPESFRNNSGIAPESLRPEGNREQGTGNREQGTRYVAASRYPDPDWPGIVSAEWQDTQLLEADGTVVDGEPTGCLDLPLSCPAGERSTPDPAQDTPPGRKRGKRALLTVSGEPMTIQDPDHPDYEPPASEYPADFEAAWAEYGRKGGKRASFAAWRRLDPLSRARLRKTIPIYHGEKPDPIYRKDFERYITTGAWEAVADRFNAGEIQ